MDVVRIVNLGSTDDISDLLAAESKNLVKITLSGAGPTSESIKVVDPTAVAGTIEGCLTAFGLKNVMSVDPDGDTGASAATGFEDIASGSQAILPITLKSFSASKDSERSVLLEWESSSEINASHYEVQRLNKFNEWKSIGNVKATGSANTNTKYTYLDTEIDVRSVYDSDSSDDLVGVNYRLRMVDLDGSVEYSDKDAVSLREYLGELSVYPNPTVDEVFVSIDNVSELGGTLNIMDNQGAIIRSQTLTNGRSEKVSLQDVPTGIYMMTGTQGDKVYTKKIVKID